MPKPPPPDDPPRRERGVAGDTIACVEHADLSPEEDALLDQAVADLNARLAQERAEPNPKSTGA